MTRKEYMANGKHREYYAQFVDDIVKQQVLQAIGLAELKASKDKHFNDIPLRQWDYVFSYGLTFAIGKKMTHLGDYLSSAGLVCIAKEAARQILDEQGKET